MSFELISVAYGNPRVSLLHRWCFLPLSYFGSAHHVAACILLGQECCFGSQSEEIKIELENENPLARLAKRERRVLRRIFAFADVVMTSKYDFLLFLHADSGRRMNALR